MSGPEQGDGVLHGCLHLSGRPVFRGNGFKNLAAMDLDASWGIDAQADPILGDAEDDDLNLAPDDDGLFQLPSDDQHEGRVSVLGQDRESKGVLVRVQGDLKSHAGLGVDHQRACEVRGHAAGVLGDDHEGEDQRVLLG